MSPDIGSYIRGASKCTHIDITDTITGLTMIGIVIAVAAIHVGIIVTQTTIIIDVMIDAGIDILTGDKTKKGY